MFLPLFMSLEDFWLNNSFREVFFYQVLATEEHGSLPKVFLMHLVALLTMWTALVVSPAKMIKLVRPLRSWKRVGLKCSSCRPISSIQCLRLPLRV